jgi:ATP-binding cassette subfamily C protein LapB
MAYAQETVFFVQNYHATFLLLAISLTVFASAIEIYQGNLDAGALLALNILISRAFRPIAAIPEITTTLAPRKRFWELDEMFARAPKKTGNRVPKAFEGKVELSGLSLRYPNSRISIYENVFIKFEAGSTTVVTGSNGVGKTSMFNMLTGNIKPTAGEILIDGLNLEQVQMDWWRDQIIAVEQEPRFLNDTLRNNLLGPRRQVSQENLAQALSASGLKSFIDQSPDGLETIIGSASATFNLGFRKRLALARASLSTGGFVIMDEPTEGLDAPGAQVFYNFLNQQIAMKKTVLVLTHDPAIIKGADDVIDLDRIQSARR